MKANGTAGDAKGCETKVTRHETKISDDDDKKLEMAGLTNEQWKVLVDMISKQKSNESEKMIGKSICDLWIIDSGASNHMTGSLENLSEKETIQRCPVRLPDGERILACEQEQ